MSINTSLGLPSLPVREDSLLKDLGLVFEIPLEDDAAMEPSCPSLGKRVIQIVGLPDFASEKELFAISMVFGVNISHPQFKRIITEFFCPQPSRAHSTGTNSTNRLLDYFLSNPDAKAQLFDSGMKIYERIKKQEKQYRFREPDLFGLVYMERTIQDFLNQFSPDKCKNEKDKAKFYLSLLELLIQSCRFQAKTDVPCKQSCIQVLLQLKNLFEGAFEGMFPLPSEEEVDTKTTGLYRNNLKDREFGKEALQNFDAERATIAERQGASEHQNSEAKPTQPKTDSSGCFGITAQLLLALIADLSTEEGETRFISLLRKVKRSWSFGDYAAFKQNAVGCPPTMRALEIAAHVERSVQKKMPSVYILSLDAFLGEKNVVECLRIKGHSIVQVVSKTHNPNYCRWIDADINFISKKFEDGSPRPSETEKHRVPICCYSEGRARELFDLRYHGFEFCELSKEIKLLNALDLYTDFCSLGKSPSIVFFRKEIDWIALNVFNQFSKVISSWAKEKEIPGVFVPWFFVYRNSNPEANATNPFFLAHVDFTKEYLENPPKEVKESWMAAARCVLGDMTEEEYDQYKRHTWMNAWTVIQQSPSGDPVAVKKGQKHGIRRSIVGDVIQLGVLHDEEDEWVVENMRRGGTIFWKTDQIAHTAIKIEVEDGEKSHRKSFDIRGAFFSKYTDS